MTLWEAILLGIIQGATEFLPISSSGHLVILPELFSITTPDLTMAGLVHAGTLLAVLIYFWPDIWAILTAVWRGLREQQPWQRSGFPTRLADPARVNPRRNRRAAAQRLLRISFQHAGDCRRIFIGHGRAARHR
jgi:hypothetical protein